MSPPGPLDDVFAVVATRTCEAPRMFSDLVAKGVRYIYLEKPGAPTVDEMEEMRKIARSGACEVYCLVATLFASGEQREPERLVAKWVLVCVCDVQLVHFVDDRGSCGDVHVGRIVWLSIYVVSSSSFQVTVGYARAASDFVVKPVAELQHLLLSSDFTDSDEDENSLLPVTLLHNNTFSEETLDECFARNSEGMWDLFLRFSCHELATAVVCSVALEPCGFLSFCCIEDIFDRD